MKKIKFALSLAIICLLLTSCYTTRTSLGNYRDTAGKPENYSKGKQVWLFWGIAPLGRTQLPVPKDGNCQVVTRVNFWDGVIFSITGGLVETETIKVLVKK